MIIEPGNQLPPFQTSIKTLEVCKLISGSQIGSVSPPGVMFRHLAISSEIGWFAGFGINVVPNAIGAVTISVHAVLESFVGRPERTPRIGPKAIVRALVEHRGLVGEAFQNPSAIPFSVRKRLAQYYTSEEGQDSPVRVVIAPGSYRPTFVLRPAVNNGSRSRDSADTDQPGMAGTHVAEDHPSPETAPSISGLRRKAPWRVWGLAAAAACVVLLVAWTAIPKWTQRELDISWEPILDSKKPAVIYAGTAPVYIRSMESVYKEQTPLNPNDEMQPATRWTLPPLAEGKVLTAKDLLVDPSGYVEVGDVNAAMIVTELLGGRRRSFDLRIGPELAFEDLHGAPTVLVGGYANFWTMFLNRDLRFYFDRNLNIRERGGQGRVWSISHEASRAASSTITEDYAIVYRLFDSKTGAPVIALAGTTTCGTRAAGEFLADPVSMRKLGNIPRDAWERKNLELVLHAPLVNCNPTSVEIVAEHTW
jgi:hypothetical protein